VFCLLLAVSRLLVSSASDKVKLESGQLKGVVCDGVVSFKGISAHRLREKAPHAS
jgi:hypothetical protein